MKPNKTGSSNLNFLTSRVGRRLKYSTVCVVHGRAHKIRPSVDTLPSTVLCIIYKRQNTESLSSITQNLHRGRGNTCPDHRTPTSRGFRKWRIHVWTMDARIETRQWAFNSSTDSSSKLMLATRGKGERGWPSCSGQSTGRASNTVLARARLQ